MGILFLINLKIIILESREPTLVRAEFQSDLVTVRYLLLMTEAQLENYRISHFMLHYDDSQCRLMV